MSDAEREGVLQGAIASFTVAICSISAGMAIGEFSLTAFWIAMASLLTYAVLDEVAKSLFGREYDHIQFRELVNGAR